MLIALCFATIAIVLAIGNSRDNHLAKHVCILEIQERQIEKALARAENHERGKIPSIPPIPPISSCNH